MRPLIFLDIDDVIAINPAYTGLDVALFFQGELGIESADLWTKLFSRNAISNLFKLHVEFVPEYVITSSWTNYLNQQQLQFVFQETGLNFVSENLNPQWTTPKSNTAGRLTELQAWISRFGNRLQPILIIDDIDSGWNLVKSDFDQNGQIVFCEPRMGFVEHRMDKARQILRQQIHTSIIEQK